MPTVIGSHSVASFVNPSNGDALDANVVKGNDNTLRAAYVNHDADPGVHVQSSVLAARPGAGVVGRKWMTTDGGVKLWYDTGSVWEEIAYVPSTGSANLPGNLVVAGNTTLNGNVVLGDAATDTVAFTGRVSTHVVPSGASQVDLGTQAVRWREVFATTVTAQSILGGQISGNAAFLQNINPNAIASGIFTNSLVFNQNLGLNNGLTISSGRIVDHVASSFVSGAQTINLTAPIVRVTLQGNATITLGQLNTGTVILQIAQDAIGGRTVTISNAVYAGGVAPTFTTTASRMDMLQVVMVNNVAHIAVLGFNYAL
jgi:hypothetical protein